MKNLKLGLKIGIGFGILILITCVLVGITALNMHTVVEDSTRVSDEYAPELAFVSDLLDNTFLSMSALTQYDLTRDAAFFQDGQKALEAIDAALAKAKVHLEKYPRLIALREKLPSLLEKQARYKEIAHEAEKMINQQNGLIETQRATLREFLKQANEWQVSQTESMHKEIAQGASQEQLDSRVEKIIQISTLISLANEGRVIFWSAFAQRDPKMLEQAFSIISEITALLDALQKTTSQEVNLRQIEAIRQAAADYKKAVEETLANWKKTEELDEQREKISEEVLGLAGDINDSAMENNISIAQRAVNSLNTAQLVLLGGLVVALILGISVSIILTRAVTVPVAKGVAFAQKIAAGDLTAQVDVDQKDELGMLAQTLREMVAKLREIVSEVQSASDNVASGSEEMSASAEQLSQGATEQAASVEEVSSSME
ncbi:MAG: HAMP domain-containing protein, partial [Desulfovibrionales bacterium]|nr:HAMP domain-containing protein [Desulfovibrionales bacterium]